MNYRILVENQAPKQDPTEIAPCTELFDIDACSKNHLKLQVNGIAEGAFDSKGESRYVLAYEVDGDDEIHSSPRYMVRYSSEQGGTFTVPVDFDL